MAASGFLFSAELIGGVAAVLTTASFLPQVWQTVRTRHAGDFSWAWIGAFGMGVAFWIGYGLMLAAPAIFLSNMLILGCVAVLALVKIRGRRDGADGEGI